MTVGVAEAIWPRGVADLQHFVHAGVNLARIP
jgi:hypothetical protein